MGNGSSFDSSKQVYLMINGSLEKIVFSLHSSTRDVQELICQAGKVNRFSQVTLRNVDGAYVTVSPTIPQNDENHAYIAEITPPNLTDVSVSNPSTDLVPVQIMEQLAREMSSRYAKPDEVNTGELLDRVKTLENRMDVEGLKAVDIDVCKKSIDTIKGQIYEAQKKFIDYNRLRDGSGLPEIGLPSKRGPSVPHYTKYILSKETIEYLKQPTFDIWHWEPNEMLSLLEHMYHELGLVREFNIHGVTLKKWLLCIQENYRNNPFHNFRHCFCVTQMMYGMIHLCKLHESISKEDIGILITACICHDLDHPGYNNTYQINARTQLALRYNDISPLENHHCAVAFEILSNPETNIFANCDTETFKRIREGIITLILATDMAQHSEIMQNFKEKLDTFDYDNLRDLIALKMVLIKCCDISNEVRPMEISEPWLDCLLEEYFNQSDKEKEQGLPVAPFMDREKVTKPTAQIGFIKFVLLPMFEEVSKLFPQLHSVMVEPLRKARDHWERLKEQDDELRHKQEA
ncbi:high affinity cGMP-specific 3',5'-cyclic phosphodiesterase 9A-like isoform X2 [Watersipora subatra]|uniref:high affinity cGMP-specific 3',5'-cyclic phosphodiesterase 9A-like isoform X2 n=1 Tax=Watersipora subatra TaxID=2589382 RepID=UPI00355AE681